MMLLLLLLPSLLLLLLLLRRRLLDRVLCTFWTVLTLTGWRARPLPSPSSYSGRQNMIKSSAYELVGGGRVSKWGTTRCSTFSFSSLRGIDPSQYRLRLDESKVLVVGVEEGGRLAAGGGGEERAVSGATTSNSLLRNCATLPFLN
jgi:hypothetical protein